MIRGKQLNQRLRSREFTFTTPQTWPGGFAKHDNPSKPLRAPARSRGNICHCTFTLGRVPPADRNRAAFEFERLLQWHGWLHA